VANTVGLSSSGATPTTVTDGTIITGNINAKAFGNARVTTGATCNEAFIRAMADNSSTADTVRITIRDTLTLRDTVEQIVEAHDTTVLYIVLDSETGAESPIEENADFTIVEASSFGQDMVYFRGLAADQPFAVYDLSGALIVRTDRMPVRLPARGVFIVAQGGRYYKFVR